MQNKNVENLYMSFVSQICNIAYLMCYNTMIYRHVTHEKFGDKSCAFLNDFQISFVIGRFLMKEGFYSQFS